MTSSSSPSDASPSSSKWPSTLTPSTLISAGAMTSALLGSRHLYKRYLRRIPSVKFIPESFWRRRSTFGRVTSVGDGDGLRLYHTPGGRLAGWEWLRPIPKGKELNFQTVSIRLAGVDAPEMAHFGRPAQKGAQEAYEALTEFVGGRRVRVYLHKRDQYERAVGTVYVRRGFLWRRRDAGLELLKLGLATVYDAKSGVEFGGPKKEKEYRLAEEKAKRWRRGIWGRLGKEWGKDRESPMEFKKRMKETEGEPPA